MTRTEALALVAAVLLAAFVGWGTVELVTREGMAEKLRAAGERYGLPGSWLVAIGWVESRLNPAAVNGASPDGARGGAWGATQITLRTAQAYGYTGTGEELAADPDLQAELTAKILAAGNPSTLADAGAWWNAGKKTASALPAGHVTLTTYIPRLESAIELVGELGMGTA